MATAETQRAGNEPGPLCVLALASDNVPDRWRSAWTVLHRTGFSQGLRATECARCFSRQRNRKLFSCSTHKGRWVADNSLNNIPQYRL